MVRFFVGSHDFWGKRGNLWAEVSYRAKPFAGVRVPLKQEGYSIRPAMLADGVDRWRPTVSLGRVR